MLNSHLQIDFWRVLHILMVISHWGTEGPGFHHSPDLLVTQKDLTHIALQVFKCLFAVFFLFLSSAWISSFRSAHTSQFSCQVPPTYSSREGMIRWWRPSSWPALIWHHAINTLLHPSPAAGPQTTYTLFSFRCSHIPHLECTSCSWGLECQSRSVGIMISPSWPDIPVPSLHSVCVLPCKSLVVIAGAFSSCSNT